MPLEMGQHTFLTPQTQALFSPSARSKARRRTCTITLLRFLAGLGGVFDIDKAKCPPDRTGGSPGWVTDDLVSKQSKQSHSLFNAPAIVAAPRPIPPRHSQTSSSLPEAPTPPLTPDIGSECGSTESSVSSIGDLVSPHSTTQGQNGQCDTKKDALDFLLTLFPHDGLKVLPYAKRLSIAAPNMHTSFDGVLLEAIPGSTQPAKTLYVDAKNAELASLRESIVALLDLADDTLGCSALIIVLERTSPVLGELLHSLMYVGGTVVTKSLFKVNPAFVLVGLEI